MPHTQKNPQIKQLPLGGTCFIPDIHVDTIIRRVWHYKPLRYSCRTVVKNGSRGVLIRRVR